MATRALHRAPFGFNWAHLSVTTLPLNTWPSFSFTNLKRYGILPIIEI